MGSLWKVVGLERVANELRQDPSDLSAILAFIIVVRAIIAYLSRGPLSIGTHSMFLQSAVLASDP